ncbi:hypothetical protein L3Y34_009404 [Caenorhabditis briggsae]|uniref:Uncharacterized protein n=1 Tax=Caenorhabditis briggsae TaxID=6238 RepID=A0AAE9A8Q4_CAEBR|nr:hypothetical protein L3Y34_009404 [Caenorhabditis briggsae]
MDQYNRERRPLAELNSNSNQDLAREYNVAWSQILRAMNVLREFSARLNGASVRDHILRIVLRIIRQQVARNEEQIVDEDNKENIRPSS